MEKKPARAIALLPIGVFLVLYLVLGIVFEYVLKIEMGFYNIPIVVAFLAAILVACLQNRALSFDEKLEVMAKGVGDKNIMTMILIFLAAGVFVGVVGRSSAESVAYFMLAHIPARFAVAVLFVVSCFVSTAMGTSCGTITLIVPIAVAVARTSGFSLPLCIGSVMGGAMFGDNLSFISDTTIAACNTQGCEMKDKFHTDFRIALPAALVTLALILVFSLRSEIGAVEIPEYHLLQTLPYLLVLIGGVASMLLMVNCSSLPNGVLLPLMLLSPQLISLFNQEPEVLRYGTLFIRYISPFYLVICINQIISGSLRGAGDSRSCMLIMLGSFVLFRQIYLMIVYRVWGAVLPVAMGYPAGWVLCSVILLLYYRSGAWKKASVFKEKAE